MRYVRDTLLLTAGVLGLFYQVWLLDYPSPTFTALCGMLIAAPAFLHADQAGRRRVDWTRVAELEHQNGMEHTTDSQAMCYRCRGLPA